MPLIVMPGQINRRAELYHQLGSMLAAGMPLIKALHMAGERGGMASSRKMFQDLIRELESGQTFSESLGLVQGWIPEFDIALLSVGEKSGRLDSSFKLLALYYAFRATIIRDTISGMLVTIATLHVFFLVFPLSYLISFVQGIMNDHYADCIPFIVEKVVVFGALYGSVFALIYACQGKRGESWRSLVESVTQMIPILRMAQKYLVLARVTAALEALNNAGVSIVKGWEMSIIASGSPALRRQVAGWNVELEGGTTPAELVNRTPYFPAVFANLYDTGEQSGKLDETLQRLHTYYQEEGFRSLRLFTRLLNGTIYGLVAIIVAAYIVNFYSGYFKAAFDAGSM